MKVNGVWQETLTGRVVPTFPLQVLRDDNEVPLPIAEEAYKEYAAQYGTDQTLERLGERGGFGPSELSQLLYDRIKRITAHSEAHEGVSV